MHIFKNTTFDFLKWRFHAIVLSWAVIIAGVFVFFTKGIPLGIEFAGGTSVQFAENPFCTFTVSPFERSSATRFA